MAAHCLTAQVPMVNRFRPGVGAQQTIKNPFSIRGIGIFTGEEVTLTVAPAPVGSGISFQRIDLPDSPIIPADLEHVVNTPRCTILGKAGVTIHTVEHLLAALRAMGIDNAVASLTGPEVPIMDGSSLSFVEEILQAGVEEQDQELQVHKLQKSMSWSSGPVHLVAIPSDEFQVSYTLHYPDSTILRSQYLSIELTPEVFASEIAPSRTFCLYEEIAPFIESGLIKGGGLDNAVIIREDEVLNPDGVRFEDEWVRHKILDLIGDISLIEPFCAHLIAIRSGHASNVAFAKELRHHIVKEMA